MKPSELKKSLEVSHRAGVPSFVWGAPGIGKSDIVRQVADEKNLTLIDVRAVLLDPVDLRGLPYVKNGKSSWAVPDFLPSEGGTILFLDELNAAPPLVQAACYQLILDGRLGEYVKPKDCYIIAAGNRENDRAITTRMSSALASRFSHKTLEVDNDEWIAWALENNIKIEVIAFMRFRPNLLFSFNQEKDEKAFPNPRTWSFVSRLLDCNPDADIEYELISGVVGEGASAEFTGFLKIYRSLPDIDSIIADPAAAVVPTDPATVYAVVGALGRKGTQANFENVIQYAERLPKEFAVLLVRDSIKRDVELSKTKAFISWAEKNQDILI